MYLGPQESTALVFMTDGVGWSEWVNGGGCEQILFRWSVESHRLVVEMHRYAYLALGDGGHSLTLVEEHGWDETIETNYAIRPGHDVVGNAATLLQLGQRISFGDRFALVRRQLRPRDDPARWTLR
jgi:hypothetical protein